MRSAVYEGIIIHHRRHPIDHRFQYRVAMPLLDLDEIEELCSLHPLWSNGRSNVVSYRRRDYLGGGPMPLAQAVRETVEDRLGTRLSGPIAMLAHPRTWGWLFNPVTLYYCFDPTGTHVEALVAEVTNTPWHERHAYVVGRPGTHHFDKALHVSPFFGMDMRYELSYRAPGQRPVLADQHHPGGQRRLRRRHAPRAERGQPPGTQPACLFASVHDDAGVRCDLPPGLRPAARRRTRCGPSALPAAPCPRARTELKTR